MYNTNYPSAALSGKYTWGSRHGKEGRGRGLDMQRQLELHMERELEAFKQLESENHKKVGKHFTGGSLRTTVASIN